MNLDAGADKIAVLFVGCPVIHAKARSQQIFMAFEREVQRFLGKLIRLVMLPICKDGVINTPGKIFEARWQLYMHRQKSWVKTLTAQTIAPGSKTITKYSPLG